MVASQVKERKKVKTKDQKIHLEVINIHFIPIMHDTNPSKFDFRQSKRKIESQG